MSDTVAGGRHNPHVEAAVVASAMFVVTAGWSWLALWWTSNTVGPLEFFGVLTGLTCVWLTRTQNWYCWPVGIVSSGLFGYMYLGDSTVEGSTVLGQVILNWGYFVPISVWAWWNWERGRNANDYGDIRVKLGVSKAGPLYAPAVLFLIALGTTFLAPVITWFNPATTLPWVDAVVVSSSVAAQFLLGQKKVMAWWLWLGPVNLLSIYLNWTAGYQVVAILYVAFAVHAVVAIRTWKEEAK